MQKRNFILIVGLCFVLGFVGMSVSALSVDEKRGDYKILSLSDTTGREEPYIDNVKVKKFNAGYAEKYLGYEVILADNAALEKVDTDSLVELIDNGATLLIEDSSLSLKEIAKMLNLERPDDRFVNGAQVTGVMVFNQNDNYCFGLMGTIQCTPIGENSIIKQEESTIANKEPIPIYQSKDTFTISTEERNHSEETLEEFINAIRDFRHEYIEQSCKEIEKDVVYMQLPEKNFDGSPYYNFFEIQNGVAGSLSITQYRYNICTYKVGKYKEAVTDVVSTFTVSPGGRMYVNNYKTRMDANVSNMDVIGQSYLNSNSSSSYTLSGGIVGNVSTISGNVSASTTNTYTTNNQTITNSFAKRKYKEWSSTPTKKWGGASWELEPCIRVVNNNANVYKSQAYSSFQKEGWIGIENMLGWEIPFVEVGGAWE